MPIVKCVSLKHNILSIHLFIDYYQMSRLDSPLIICSNSMRFTCIIYIYLFTKRFVDIVDFIIDRYIDLSVDQCISFIDILTDQ